MLHRVLNTLRLLQTLGCRNTSFFKTQDSLKKATKAHPQKIFRRNFDKKYHGVPLKIIKINYKSFSKVSRKKMFLKLLVHFLITLNKFKAY